MAHEIASKSIDGITDLVVVAPIKEGFIPAYENVTYATRLRIVAEALNRVRIAAREYEPMTPFSDVTERILTLLDFRIGVIDKDLFALDSGKEGAAPTGLQSRRYLYLTATFDGAWEPYMRLIWDPLGPFLDLLFCNCEDYVTASEHSFERYSQWVRDNQVDSAIFYATTGLTVRDHLYLNRLEQVQRSLPAAEADREIAQLRMPDPEAAAAAERADSGNIARIHELALEALTVLYRLADYYPPEWLARQDGLSEGHYLLRVAESLLLGWEQVPRPQTWPVVAKLYADPLNWFETGRKHLAELDSRRASLRAADPVFDPAEIQGGVITPQGSREAPMRRGALLFMTITKAESARLFLAKLDAVKSLHFDAGTGDMPLDGFFRTIAFTADGLRRIGLGKDVLDCFPKEFREGMEMRSGLFGDMRENHPRNWTLPERNWPPLADSADAFAKARPPIDLSEIDLVLQLRIARGDEERLMREIRRLAAMAGPGVALIGYQLMHADYDGEDRLRDYFGYSDGISQPRPRAELDPSRKSHRDEVPLGEILLGYRNERGDFAPEPDGSDARDAALGLQANGSFLVIRKLEQKAEAFERLLAAEARRINTENPSLSPAMTVDRLKAVMLGREPSGKPLVAIGPGGLNDFDYQGADGQGCPLASHIRRANPRELILGRNPPRLMRRGMSFDDRVAGGADAAAEGRRGLIFMAYNASIAEQFETIQRWINGGNSTGIASAHGDPIMGVAPKKGALNKAERVFRFVEQGKVIRMAMPEPFVALHWGLYLFVPSRSALARLRTLDGSYDPLGHMVESRGEAQIARLDRIENGGEEGREWKRLLEDFDAKDPSERDLSTHVWAAIRGHKGGSIRVGGGIPWSGRLPFLSRVKALLPTRREARASAWEGQAPEDQPVVLAASCDHAMRVLSDWRTFTTEEQLRRIEPSGIPIFVTQQPDDRYRKRKLRGRFSYRAESEPTNAILMAYGEEEGFADGYQAGSRILAREKDFGGSRGYFKIELRRQYILPALEALCVGWYGLPDAVSMVSGAWNWAPASERPPCCPGDFLSPSRGTFYPRPGEQVSSFAEQHGRAIHDGMADFVRRNRQSPEALKGSIARAMFEAIEDDDVLTRNLVGTMIGALPPMDGNLRGILLEWLSERTLWRHQAALRRALGDRPAAADFATARSILYGAISQAICKRPAPDLVYRTALRPARLKAANDRANDVAVAERDLVVVSLVSAAQHSLEQPATPDGDVSIVFGGKRKSAWQGDLDDPAYPVHACPAQPMAMGAMMGIVAALLDCGRIQVMPASMIVRISDWSRSAPAPAPQSKASPSSRKPPERV